MLNCEIKKLSAMPYAQAHVEIRIRENGQRNIQLFSYVTLVCEIDENGWFSINGLYSRTTIKHISAFMREYTPFDYYSAKLCYKDDMVINIETGEVLPRADYELKELIDRHEEMEANKFDSISENFKY